MKRSFIFGMAPTTCPRTKVRGRYTIKGEAKKMKNENRKYSAVFSDIDGTLLNSQHRVTPLTAEAIGRLREAGIPFMLVSARSPGEIYPLLEEYGLNCGFISCSGGLIMDENRNVLYRRGMEADLAWEIVDFVEEQRFDAAWNVYSQEQWLVKDKADPRVLREEQIVNRLASQGNRSSLTPGEAVYKLMCICAPGETLRIEERLKEKFPECTIVKSSEILIEIMAGGVNKAKAVEWLCGHWGISPREALAFGDNYNDLEMLELCRGVVMGNAPEEIKKKIGRVTADNDHDGIYEELCRSGLLD